jgi:hypothetical protein
VDGRDGVEHPTKVRALRNRELLAQQRRGVAERRTDVGDMMGGVAGVGEAGRRIVAGWRTGIDPARSDGAQRKRATGSRRSPPIRSDLSSQ